MRDPNTTKITWHDALVSPSDDQSNNTAVSSESELLATRVSKTAWTSALRRKQAPYSLGARTESMTIPGTARPSAAPAAGAEVPTRNTGPSPQQLSQHSIRAAPNRNHLVRKIANTQNKKKQEEKSVTVKKHFTCDEITAVVKTLESDDLAEGNTRD